MESNGLYANRSATQSFKVTAIVGTIKVKEYLGLVKKDLAVFLLVGHSTVYLIDKKNGKLYGWLRYLSKEPVEKAIKDPTKYMVIKRTKKTAFKDDDAAGVERSYAEFTRQNRPPSKELGKFKKD